MKPLRKGAARTALAEGLKELVGTHTKEVKLDPALSSIGTFSLTTEQIASIIGGAIEQSLTDMGHDAGQRAIFWRYTGHNLWNLIRSLRASNQLEKV